MKTLIFDLQLFSGNCQVLDASANVVYEGDFESVTDIFADDYILNDNYTIRLLENCTSGVRIIFRNNVTLDLNSYTVTNKKSTGALFTVNNGATVTIQNGTIENNTSSGSAIANYANLFVNNANIIGAKYGILNGGGSNAVVNDSKVTGGNSAFYNTGNIVVNGSDTADEFNFKAKDIAINGGAGNDTITSSGRNVTINSDDGNDRITNSGSRNLINGGNGDDYITNSGVSVTIVASAGNDTLEGIKSSTNINAEVVLSKIENNNVIITTADGALTILDGKDKTFILNGVSTIFGSKSNYGEGANDEVILIGTDGNDTITDDGESVFIYGESGNDTIYGGASAYIDAGTGLNYVSMSDKGKSTLNFAEGKTTVDNFNFADGDKADTIKTGSVAISKVKVESGNVILETSNGHIEIEEAENEAVSFENDYIGNTNLQVGDQKLIYDGVTNSYWAAGKNSTVIVGDIDAETAEVILDNTSDTKFYGSIKDIDASEFNGSANLVGNDKNNIIIASAGGSTLVSSEGKDTLYGGAGKDVFVVGQDKDIIKYFMAGTSEVADVISIGDSEVEAMKVSGNDLIVTTENGRITVEGVADEVVQFQNQYIEGDKPLAVQISDNKISVNDDASYYWATGKNATVSVEDYGGDSLDIDLSNTDYNNRDKIGFYGDIKAVNASYYEGAATISGNENNNVLTASSGGSTLWGGGQSNDTLIGGDGADEFIYSAGDGDDVISNANDKDTIVLRGVSFTDIMDADNVIFNGNDVKITMNDGGTLTVKDAKTSEVTFSFDGQNYAVNKDSSEWETK